jgi:hypothetical protein
MPLDGHRYCFVSEPNGKWRMLPEMTAETDFAIDVTSCGSREAALVLMNNCQEKAQNFKMREHAYFCLPRVQRNL